MPEIQGIGLPEIINALKNTRDALLEEEYAYAIAILDPDDAGISTNNLWF
jgi:hypothetical protein